MSMKLNVGIRGLGKETNIMDIKVPEALRHKKLSGIDWLDNGLGEGFTPSTCMMLTGGAGCGKTTLLLQLANSLTEQGHVVLLNSAEESLYQVKMVVDRLKLKHGFICGQDVSVHDVLAHANEIRAKFPKKQMFLLQDSLQTLNDDYYKDGGTTGSTPIRCCELLTNWVKETYAICVFIGQVTKSGEFAGKNTIKHAIDIHGELHFDTAKKSETFGERIFEINKNRFGASGKAFIVGMGKEGLYEKGSFQDIG